MPTKKLPPKKTTKSTNVRLETPTSTICVEMPAGAAFDALNVGPWRVAVALGVLDAPGVAVTKLRVLKASFKRGGRKATGPKRLLLEIDYDTGTDTP